MVEALKHRIFLVSTGFSMADRGCRFVTNRGAGDSPAKHAGEVVFETLILPVMAHFPEFTTHLFEYENEPGSISDDFLDSILSVDLVIADLTDLAPSGYFQLGRRHQAGLPIVFIADEEYVLALHPTNFRFVRYPFESPGPSGDDKRATAELTDAVKKALSEEARGSATALPQKKMSPQEARSALVSRIHEAADAIRLLRINSASQTVGELESIANDLEQAPDDKISPALQETVEKVLAVLSRLADQLASVRGARMLISGAIAIVLGGAGFSAVTAFGMSLAFWEGKDAFLKALSVLSKRKK